jgi:TonB family protein
MISRIVGLIFFLLTVAFGTAADTDPVLTSANLPKYPPLACQAREHGVVRLRFTLPAHGNEPTNIEVLSGHPLLKDAAVENVNTWRFDNPYAIDRTYETEFDYELSGRELPPGEAKTLTVSVTSFQKVKIITDVYEPSVNY